LSEDDQVQSTKDKVQKHWAEWNEMILAKVLGNVVATQKNHRYESARVMMCEQMTPEGDMTGHTVLALDAVDAGVGDTVLIVQEGWSASTVATGKAGAAIDSAIVGVVDRIDLLETET
jgi:ethanolamine utilization protein EutN